MVDQKWGVSKIAEHEGNSMSTKMEMIAKNLQ
jgi:hypothetical protein